MSLICVTLGLMGCEQQTQIKYVVPDVPEQLREPVATPERDVDTLQDVALVLTDHVEALGRANGQILAIDCILDAAESGEQPQCLEEG